MKWAGSIACLKKTRIYTKFWQENPKGRGLLAVSSIYGG
jgi:hypothetical protein